MCIRDSTSAALAGGADQLIALNDGYRVAFLVGACFAGLAAILGAVLLKSARMASPDAEVPDSPVA